MPNLPPETGSEKKAQLEQAMANYKYLIKSYYGNKEYFKMIPDIFRITSVAMLYLFRSIKGDFK